MMSDFPLFFKYRNDKSFFKVESSELMEEIKIIGNYYSVSTIMAKTLPDRLFIQDMIANVGSFWIRIDQAEYRGKKEFCEIFLTKFQA